MENFELIKSLIGQSVTEEDLKYVDCYVHNKLGLFIPSLGPCQYAIRPSHTHPAYAHRVRMPEVFLSAASQFQR